MKKKNQSQRTVRSVVFLLLVLIAGFSSCKNDDSLNREPDGDMEIVLTSSVRSVVLQDRFFDQDAFDIAWTKGSNMLTEYQIEIDLKGNEFLTPATIISPVSEERKMAFKHEFLNNLIKENRPTMNGDHPKTFEFRACGLDYGKTVLVSNPIDIQITTYTLGISGYDPIWIKGDAIGKLTGDETKVEYNERAGKYEWKGYLSPEDGFIFGFFPDQSVPSYIKGDNANTVKIKENTNDPDIEFTVPEYNYYKITLDPEALTIDISLTPIFEEGIWIAGNYNGWDYVNMPKMMPSEDNPNIFVYEGIFEHTQTFNFPVSSVYYDEDRRKRDRLMPVEWTNWGWGNLYYGIYPPYDGTWIDCQLMTWSRYIETEEGMDSINWNGSMYNFWYGDGMDGQKRNFRITVDALNKKVSILQID
jgi:hypothetical protein